MCLAVVGTRRATADGVKSAFELSYQLAKAGAVIVSGGALGADQAALEGALQARGRTVTVLGCGVDVDYPPNFARLRSRILENGGAVLSEYPPGTEPKGRPFSGAQSDYLRIVRWNTGVERRNAAAR